jgi:hypothetical protein
VEAAKRLLAAFTVFVNLYPGMWVALRDALRHCIAEAGSPFST